MQAYEDASRTTCRRRRRFGRLRGGAHGARLRLRRGARRSRAARRPVHSARLHAEQGAASRRATRSTTRATRARSGIGVGGARDRHAVHRGAQARAGQGLRRLPHRRHRAVSALPRRGALSFADAVGRRRRRSCWSRRASSSRPAASFRRACFPGLADTGFVDSDAVLEAGDAFPSRSIVLGGGYTACELGQFLARMGARTTMLIRSGHLLTSSDDDVGDALTGYFREEGIDVVTRRRPARRARDATARKSCVTCTTARSARSRPRRSSTRSGRSPNVAGLDLERPASRSIPTAASQSTATMRTSNPNIFAVGRRYRRVHARARRDLPGRDRGAQRRASTRAKSPTTARLGAHTVFTDPQVAAVGASEKELRASGIPYVVGRYDFAEHGKAHVPEQRPRAS